jgi:hypothetical protein
MNFDSRSLRDGRSGHIEAFLIAALKQTIAADLEALLGKYLEPKLTRGGV